MMSEVVNTMLSGLLSGLLSYLTRHREVTSELVSLAWPALLQGLLLTLRTFDHFVSFLFDFFE